MRQQQPEHRKRNVTQYDTFARMSFTTFVHFSYACDRPIVLFALVPLMTLQFLDDFGIFASLFTCRSPAIGYISLSSTASSSDDNRPNAASTT